MAGLNYATAMVPLFGTQLATWKSSHQMAVIRQANKVQVEAGLRLAQFASANSVIWDESGMSPVLKAAADDPRLANLKVHSKGFMDSIPIARFMPLIPQGWEELFEASPDRPIMQAIESYMRAENPDVDSILKAANDKMNEILARYYH